MRRALSRVPAAILLLLVACNSPGSSSSSSTSSGDQQSDSTSASATQSSSASASSGGGTGSDDIDQIASDLTPPNSSETGRYSASGALIVAWSSTDSVDSLKSYYDGKLGSLNLNVLSTTDVQGTHGWVFGNEDNSGVSGALTISPDTSSGGATTVSLTIGLNQ
jgi:hypothetical protein